jgi:L-ribulose-5-phosphate 3-epimerase
MEPGHCMSRHGTIKKWPLGIFASSDSGLGIHFDVAHELGFETIHLHAPRRQPRTSELGRELTRRLADLNITVTCVFAGFDGESYADIPTVKRTVGLVPAGARPARLQELKEIADFAGVLGVDAVGLHIGFVPHERDRADYRDLVTAAGAICRHCAANDQSLHLETGQESADVLLQFMLDVGHANLFVNFDPANMILYGVGEPLEALKRLGERVRSVHCKDAKWSDQPGVTWGREVALGDGDVNIPAFVEKLAAIDYSGPLTLECESHQDPLRQRSELRRAAELLRRIESQLSAS